MLTASNDKTARIWDAETGKLLLRAHRARPGRAWTPPSRRDADRVITGSEDNTAKIWDAATGQEILSLEGHTASVTSVAFSPDGRRAATGSQDNTAKIWDAQTGNEIPHLEGPFARGHLRCVFARRPERADRQSRRTLILWLASDWHDEKPAIESQIGAIAIPPPAR